MSQQDRETSGPERPEENDTSTNEEEEHPNEGVPAQESSDGQSNTFPGFFNTPHEVPEPAPSLEERVSPPPGDRPRADYGEEAVQASQTDAISENSQSSRSSNDDLSSAIHFDGAPGQRTLRVVERRVNRFVEDATNTYLTEALESLAAATTRMTESFEKRLAYITERQLALMSDTFAQFDTTHKVKNSLTGAQPKKLVEPYESLQPDTS